VSELPKIDWQASALGPVRQHVEARITDRTKKIVNPRTPLDEVPGYRGEIAALDWLLEQLARPKDVIA
jgi:hypothetical protein